MLALGLLVQAQIQKRSRKSEAAIRRSGRSEAVRATSLGGQISSGKPFRDPSVPKAKSVGDAETSTVHIQRLGRYDQSHTAAPNRKWQWKYPSRGISLSPTHHPKVARPMNYEDYIRSEKWKRVRKRYAKNYPMRCYVCGSTKRVQLHHKTYKRLGRERMSDLLWLCEECHMLVHAVVGKGRFNLWNSARRCKDKCQKRGKSGLREWVRRYAKEIDWTLEIEKAKCELREAHEAMGLV